MASLEERLNKLREERLAREKARIEKLRELNLKKYGKTDIQQPKPSTTSIPVKTKPDSSISKNTANTIKNTSQVNGIKRPTSVPIKKPTIPPKTTNNVKNNTSNNIKSNNTKNLNQDVTTKTNKIANVSKSDTKCTKNIDNGKEPLKEITAEVIKHMNGHVEKPKIVITEPDKEITKTTKVNARNDLKSRKSIAVSKIETKSKSFDSRKSMQLNQKVSKESVFDRLYKPKIVAKKCVDNVEKLKTDPNYLKKVINESRLITNKRHTMFTTKPPMPVRRSISAVHFKRISKNELSNCFHKWASIGEKIDKVHLQDINEDDCINDDKVISAIKSERKSIRNLTPVPTNFNTPRLDEMRVKLQSWLKKRGKPIDSYHHLQCFGLQNWRERRLDTPSAASWNKKLDTPNFEAYDDENKENIALEHDSDNDSYIDNMNQNGDLNGDLNEGNKVQFSTDKWRRASCISDSVDLNESFQTMTTTSEKLQQVDQSDQLLEYLNSLTELLREGYDWEQCARYLRAIRDRYPFAPEGAPYWECRAALEERRGDLPASVSCWEQAVDKGAQKSIAEANLNQMLDKFRQLKISPNSGKRQDHNLDMNNVFNSTRIRFAVKLTKMSQPTEAPKYTVTPVRRSSRVSMHWRTQTPLRECTSIHQASEMGAEFIPNKALVNSP